MEWTQTEKAAEKKVATQQAAAAPAPAQNQGGKKGDKKSVHISELSMQQLQNIGREFNFYILNCHFIHPAQAKRNKSSINSANQWAASRQLERTSLAHVKPSKAGRVS